MINRLENLRVISESEHHAIHVARGDYGRRPYKLTEEQILDIVVGHEPAWLLAGEYGVSQATIYYHRRKANALLKTQGRA